MLTEAKLPIEENPADYIFESGYLKEEPNCACYYIAGKGVCQTRDEEPLWYDMPSEDRGCFAFGEAVLNEYLHDDFTDGEKRALSFIRELDRQAQEVLLRVVSTQNHDDGQYVLFYSEASEAYCRVLLDEIDRVNLITANIMAQLAPCSLAEPYALQIREDGAFLQ